MALTAIPYLIDANVLIGAFDTKDALHEQAFSILSDLVVVGGTGVVLDHVIQETLSVFLYRSANELASQLLERLQSDPSFFTVETPLIWMQESIDLAKQQRFRPKISLTDWLILYRSFVTGAPILTFDKQLLAASKKLC